MNVTWFQIQLVFMRHVLQCTVWLGKVEGKGKVVPVLFLTEHHAMKAY
jgi:hypothetical protein